MVMDFRHEFSDLSIEIDHRLVGTFSGEFEMAIDSTGDAYIETINVDTTDGSANLILRQPARTIAMAVLWFWLHERLLAQYRSVLDDFANANELSDCSYGPSQAERS